MSSILLSNPFAMPSLPQSPMAGPGQPNGSSAVKPMQAGTGSSGTGNAASDRGPYARHDEMVQHRIMRSAQVGEGLYIWDARPSSVVAAQTYRNEAYSDLPKNHLATFDMPDPLPTAPILLAMRKAS